MSCHEVVVDRAVARAFSVLECLLRAGEPLRLTEIVAATDLQKSTAHRLLSTLVALGYVRQDASGRYGASLRTWELGARTAAQLPIKRIAAGFLHGLHRTIGETVSLTLLSGADVLYLDKIIAPRPVQFRTSVGSRAPAVLTASGKAILSQRPDGEALARAAASSLNLDISAVEAELGADTFRGTCTVDVPFVSGNGQVRVRATDCAISGAGESASVDLDLTFDRCTVTVQ